MFAAEQFDGVIINADSVQLYRDLAILTARPDAADEERVDHELYGILAADDDISAADWLNLAKEKIAQTKASGRLPVITGGTGLYLGALINGLAPIPEIDPAIRTRIRQMNPEDVSRCLSALDPIMDNRLKPADRQRRSRALEVILSTGRSIDEWQKQSAKLPSLKCKIACILPQRGLVRERARDRMAKMIELGALEQVRSLRAKYSDPLSLPIRKTLGLAELLQADDGKISLEKAVELTNIRVGQYIKRQETWFRRQLPQANFITDFGEDDAAKTELRQLVAIAVG